jgi:outer membrane protein, heavy metal efflux system
MHQESRSDIESIETRHPQLQYLQATIDVMQGTVEQARLGVLGSPTITLGNRRQRDFRLQEYIDSVSLSVSIPFGGRRFVDSRVSSAMRDKTDIEVEYRRVERELTLQLHEVEHELFLVEQEQVLARQQADLERRQWDMAQAAFALGEIDMTQVVTAMQRARSSSRQVVMLGLRQQRLWADYNQVVGVLP